MAGKQASNLVNQICDVRSRNGQMWVARLSPDDRELAEAVLKQVVDEHLPAYTIARELKKHITTSVGHSTIAKWMRSYVTNE
mgnify:CR=1 FL=1